MRSLMNPIIVPTEIHRISKHCAYPQYSIPKQPQTSISCTRRNPNPSTMLNPIKVATEIHCISKCTVKPRLTSEESLQPCYLTPWDLSFLSMDYIQTGLLFTKPQHIPTQALVDQLKYSLECTLTHFFPLSGRLVTKNTVVPPSYSIFLDCDQGPGAEFVHATAGATMSDIISPKYVPSSLVESLFPLHRLISHDGHSLPLLGVQITELVDGIFIGCSFSHIVGDGSSFWHFFNAWSEISRSTELNKEYMNISRPPLTKRWFISNQQHVINLPYSHPDEFIARYVPGPYIERIFHFSSESIAHLKAKANQDLGTKKISSYQALGALVWRSLTRARGLSADQETKCVITIDDRSRLDPPLSRDYFGNFVRVTYLTTTAGELLSNNLGWSAWMLNQEIAQRTDIKVRSMLEAYPNAPFFYKFAEIIDSGAVGYGMSPRLDVYTNDFGWGEPVAVRSGCGIKFDGKVTWFPGREGGGSMELEICLVPKSMDALEVDHEFTSAVSWTPAL